MIKKCTKCRQKKDTETEFYSSGGILRSECKECTIKRNMRYQQKYKTWRFKVIDKEKRREYMRAYYQKNKPVMQKKCQPSHVNSFKFSMGGMRYEKD